MSKSKQDVSEASFTISGADLRKMRNMAELSLVDVTVVFDQLTIVDISRMELGKIPVHPTLYHWMCIVARDRLNEIIEEVTEKLSKPKFIIRTIVGDPLKLDWWNSIGIDPRGDG